jgi:hypothetical protein
MGYFSNGTEGEIYEARYYSRCQHYPRDAGDFCPVWWAHLMHCGEDGAQEVLDILIPQRADRPGNEQCAMFTERKEKPDDA